MLNDQKHNRAFSLIELVLVLVLIGIVAAIAMPRISNASSQYMLESASQRALYEIEYAKAIAKATSSSYTMHFDSAGQRIYLSGPNGKADDGVVRELNLNDSIYEVSMNIDLSGETSFIINGFGMPEKMYEFDLYRGSYKQKINVDCHTGEVSLE
ncbi:prepilin-type N-terminal cleavage/methylation domain-containing protein [Poriferisphaera sp. WC338]|uniref:prepilin-type N-terminal cleavage/methylation domain-containing protein n=1 Tax=Poriferisphaera sp. WC338 TaxID=3425129 RepID=UPI003D81B68A